jgi:hypothetical protein
MEKTTFARCPFCGKSDTLFIDTLSEADGLGYPSQQIPTNSYAVTCDASKPDGPGGCGGCGGYFPSEDGAVAAWNRRAEVERLAAQAEPAPAPAREVRLLNDDEQTAIIDVHNTGRAQGDHDCSGAIQRKFCEVNGLTIKEQS